MWGAFLAVLFLPPFIFVLGILGDRTDLIGAGVTGFGVPFAMLSRVAGKCDWAVTALSVISLVLTALGLALVCCGM